MKEPTLSPNQKKWILLQIEFLNLPQKLAPDLDKERLNERANIVQNIFLGFKIEGEVVAIRPGPVITLFEFIPTPGAMVSRIATLADDISTTLSTGPVRIVYPIPGKDRVGIELPSEPSENVFMRELLEHPDFRSDKHALPIAIGKDIAGNIHFGDLTQMSHIFCAGQTGSGKSIFINGLICSLLFRFTPDELRFILADPKMIEFADFEDIPHLLCPVIDDTSQSVTALKWATTEISRRQHCFAAAKVKDFTMFNQWVDETKDPENKKLPYVVIVIDEMADLMMIQKTKTEIAITCIAQQGHAVGVHLIIATQRPSSDVVTELIKAIIPSRISFTLACNEDSKTILDRAGAERLLGRGDMLFLPPGSHHPMRLHAAFINDDEIHKVTQFWRDQGEPSYLIEGLNNNDEEVDDPLLEKAIDLVMRTKSASASNLQRQLQVGYNRAARMIETMEERGIVGPADK